jgi:hypothetical protein
MELQPRHAAAQITLLELSFVFLPCLMQRPLVWNDNFRQLAAQTARKSRQTTRW